MSNKKVAGTVMLNQKDGTKRFLVHPSGQMKGFITTVVSDDMTGLASILKFFKEKIHIDITSIDLVELTNAHSDQENLPLFVFEMSGGDKLPTINDQFVWEQPSELKKLLTSYEIEGVPMF